MIYECSFGLDQDHVEALQKNGWTFIPYTQEPYMLPYLDREGKFEGCLGKKAFKEISPRNGVEEIEEILKVNTVNAVDEEGIPVHRFLIDGVEYQGWSIIHLIYKDAPADGREAVRLLNAKVG